MTVQKIAGIVIVLLAIIGGAVYSFMTGDIGGPEQIVVSGLYGGEKEAFIKNPRVVEILRSKYGITVQGDKEGSISMIDRAANQDFLWPSVDISTELYQSRYGSNPSTRVIFSSPIVIYSWKPVSDALEKNGIVQKRGDNYYIVDFPKLIKAVIDGKTWADVGLPQLFGKARVTSTDPTQSMSGMLFFIMTANTIANTGDAITVDDLSKVLPIIKTFRDRLGRLSDSSGTVFREYLEQKMGKYPLLVGYENQLIELGTTQPDLIKNAGSDLRVLYPEPTVWSNHPMISLTKKGKALSDALLDSDIQKIAWEEHGFRSSVYTSKIDGRPDQIVSVMTLPTADVVQPLLDALK